MTFLIIPRIPRIPRIANQQKPFFTMSSALRMAQPAAPRMVLWERRVNFQSNKGQGPGDVRWKWPCPCPDADGAWAAGVSRHGSSGLV